MHKEGSEECNNGTIGGRHSRQLFFLNLCRVINY